MFVETLEVTLYLNPTMTSYLYKQWCQIVSTNTPYPTLLWGALGSENERRDLVEGTKVNNIRAIWSNLFAFQNFYIEQKESSCVSGKTWGIVIESSLNVKGPKILFNWFRPQLNLPIIEKFCLFHEFPCKLFYDTLLPLLQQRQIPSSSWYFLDCFRWPPQPLNIKGNPIAHF